MSEEERVKHTLMLNAKCLKIQYLTWIHREDFSNDERWRTKTIQAAGEMRFKSTFPKFPSLYNSILH